MKAYNFQTLVLAAQPGFERVCGMFDDNHKVTGLYKMPVIAWQVSLYKRDDGSTFHEIEPLCLESPSDPIIIREPTGRTFAQEDMDFESDGEIMHYIETYNAKRK